MGSKDFVFVFQVGDLELREKRGSWRGFLKAKVVRRTRWRTCRGRFWLEKNEVGKIWGGVMKGKRSNLVKTEGRERRSRRQGRARKWERASVRDTGLPRVWGGRSHHCPRGFPPGEMLRNISFLCVIEPLPLFRWKSCSAFAWGPI